MNAGKEMKVSYMLFAVMVILCLVVGPAVAAPFGFGRRQRTWSFGYRPVPRLQPRARARSRSSGCTNTGLFSVC